MRLDPRLKILFPLGGSILTQYLGGACLAAWLAALCLLLPLRDLRTRTAVRLLRGGAAFGVFWFFAQMLASLFNGKGVADSALDALPFTARLLALAILGIAFVSVTPPAQTGKAATWYLRPFAGEKAWKAGLALALAGWFLPKCLDLVARTGDAARARGLALAWRDRMRFGVGTTVRILEKQAELLADGLAARRLDSPEVWKMCRDGWYYNGCSRTDVPEIHIREYR
jgi:energy-coupling factor transporter transmembrane protein EcfT